MPEDLVGQLKNVRNKSYFIAQALREKISRDKKKNWEQLLIEGHQKVKEEDKKLDQDWSRASLEDGWK